VAELQQVLGFTPELYEAVAPVLTVHSGAQSIDPSTAPVAALLALPGATPAQVAAAWAARGNASLPQHGDESNGSELGGDSLRMLDDVVRNDPGSSGQVVRQRQHPAVTITSKAQTPGGGIFERLAVVRLTNDPVRPFLILEWRQVWEVDPDPNDGTDTSREEDPGY
jgi:hypothetical protein